MPKRLDLGGLINKFDHCVDWTIRRAPSLIRPILRAKLAYSPPKDTARHKKLKTQLSKANFKALKINNDRLYHKATTASTSNLMSLSGRLNNNHFSDVFHQKMTLPIAYNVINGHVIDNTLAIFHDCPLNDITIQQTDHPSVSSSRFALDLDVGDFEGQYLALTYKLPIKFMKDLHKARKLVITMHEIALQDRSVFGRINIKYKNGLHQCIKPFKVRRGRANCTFDLRDYGVSKISPERMWVEISFDNPQASKVRLLDLGVSQTLFK